jgi:hypothetical protein
MGMILDRIDNDDLGYVSAGNNHKTNHNGNYIASDHKELVFTYSKCYSLYQLSENLENWCKDVQHYVRTNAALFESPGDAYHNHTYADHHNVAEFQFMIYLAPDYTLRVINSAPDWVGI